MIVDKRPKGSQQFTPEGFDDPPTFEIEPIGYDDFYEYSRLVAINLSSAFRHVIRACIKKIENLTVLDKNIDTGAELARTLAAHGDALPAIMASLVSQVVRHILKISMIEEPDDEKN